MATVASEGRKDRQRSVRLMQLQREVVPFQTPSGTSRKYKHWCRPDKREWNKRQRWPIPRNRYERSVHRIRQWRLPLRSIAAWIRLTPIWRRLLLIGLRLLGIGRPAFFFLVTEFLFVPVTPVPVVIRMRCPVVVARVLHIPPPILPLSRSPIPRIVSRRRWGRLPWIEAKGVGEARRRVAHVCLEVR